MVLISPLPRWCCGVDGCSCTLVKGAGIRETTSEPRQNPVVTTAFSLFEVAPSLPSTIQYDKNATPPILLTSPQFAAMNPMTLRPLFPRIVTRRRICFFIPRGYATQSPGNPAFQVFNRNTKYLQRERAANNVERSRRVDYLKDEVAMRLTERLLVSI